MRLQEEVPVPKSRRVLPEHEGGYKITMPSGTTAKTQKILEQGLPAGRLTENTECLPLQHIKTIYFPSPLICKFRDTCSSVKEVFIVPTHTHRWVQSLHPI